MLFTNKAFTSSKLRAWKNECRKFVKRSNRFFSKLVKKSALFHRKARHSFYLHIAQHRRRSVYPPEETWAAFGPNKRGYKMDAHFQIGITREYAFVWLSVIDQPKTNSKSLAAGQRNRHCLKLYLKILSSLWIIRNMAISRSENGPLL